MTKQRKTKEEMKEEKRLRAETVTEREVMGWETVGNSLTEAPHNYDPETDMVAVIYPSRIKLFFNRSESGFNQPYPCWFEESREIGRASS